MATELKNRVELDLCVHIPIAWVLDGATLTDLANYLLDKLITPAAPVEPAIVSLNRAPEELLGRIDQLSDTEVDALLDDMITEAKSTND